MRRNLLTILCFFLFILSSNAATIIWSGAGDGTKWDDPANWMGGAVPAAGDIAKIGGNNLNLTGVATNNPSRVLVNWGVVTFNLDLTIDGQGGPGAFTAWGTVTFVSGTCTINPMAGQEGLVGGSNPIVVASGANVNITDGSTSLKVTGSFTNNGTLLLNGATSSIKILNNGNLINNGTISHSSSTMTGMVVWGELTNNLGGHIVSHTTEDRIIIDGSAGGSSLFTNNGFVDSGNGPPVVVNNGGTFVNNGLIKSFWPSIVTNHNSSSTNNGFYKYGAIAVFSVSWSGTPTIVDDGIDLKNPMSTTVEEVSGMAKIANAVHSYSFSSSFTEREVSSTRASGSISSDAAGNIATATLFPAAETSATLTHDQLPGVVITVTKQVLPVVLIDFKAEAKGSSVSISWSTASEINSDYIEVEHSQDGKSFVQIERVMSSGNTNMMKDYSVLDRNTVIGTNYYRLKQVDKDGKVSLSEVLSVDIKSRDGQMWSIRPTNIEKNESITLDLGNYSETIVEVAVYTMTGQRIFAKKLIGGSVETLDFSVINDGVYLVSVKDQFTTSTKRVIVH